MKPLVALMLVTACLACSNPLPEPKVGLREAACKTTLLLLHLGQNESLVQEVLDGTMTVEGAIEYLGGLPEDAERLRNDLKVCEPRVVAPPPGPGNKVI